MKLLKTVIVSILLLFVSVVVHSQSSYCNNLNFELGNFTDREGYTWQVSNSTEVPSTPPKPDFNLQTIMSKQAAFDYNTNLKLKITPAVYQHSTRISDLYPDYDRASLKYTPKVDSMNALFAHKYATVMIDNQNFTR